MIARNRSIATSSVRFICRIASRHIVNTLNYVTSERRTEKFERMVAMYALAIAVGASALALPKLPHVPLLPNEQKQIVKQVGEHRWPAKKASKHVHVEVVVRPAQHPEKSEQCVETEPCDVSVSYDELLRQ
jgi:hypothetical protein